MTELPIRPLHGENVRNERSSPPPQRGVAGPILDNPYANHERLGLPHMARVNTCVDARVIRDLMSMHPRPPGVVKNTVNILIFKLMAELKRRGIDNVSKQNEFITFLTECQLGLPGELLPSTEPDLQPRQPVNRGPIPASTATGPDLQTPQPHDPRGASGDGGQPPRPSQQQGGVQQTGESAKKRVGGRPAVAKDRNV